MIMLIISLAIDEICLSLPDSSNPDTYEKKHKKQKRHDDDKERKKRKKEKKRKKQKHSPEHGGLTPSQHPAT